MNRKHLLAVGSLFTINLLNYMNRSALAGSLNDVMAFYHINNSMAGFLHTVFSISFILTAPVCEYLANHYSPFIVTFAGLLVWIGAVLGSSFISSDYFWSFVILRGIIGISEAFYSVIISAIVADLFIYKLHSQIVAFFYFAIPIGGSVGYAVSAYVIANEKARSRRGICPNCWQSGVRIIPMIGSLSMITLLFSVDELVTRKAKKRTWNLALPVHSALDESLRTAVSTISEKKIQKRSGSFLTWLRSTLRSYANELCYMAKNVPFLFYVIGFTALLFVTSSLLWWSPVAIQMANAWKHNLTDDFSDGLDNIDSLILGGYVCTAGIVGIGVGLLLSQKWHQKNWCFVGAKADLLFSSIGSIAAIPLLLVSLRLVTTHLYPALLTLFFTIVCLCFNILMNASFLMRIVIPNHRNSANVVLMIISHLFGDAIGPWIVGQMADRFRADRIGPEWKFRSLKSALYLPNGMLLLSCAAFLAAAYAMPTENFIEPLVGQKSMKKQKKINEKVNSAKDKAPIIQKRISRSSIWINGRAK